MIWKKAFTIENLNKNSTNTLVGHLGIEFIESGPDFLKAIMPVDVRTVQPFGLLHGGASAALAETLGSMAGFLCLEDPNQAVVGVEINANHLKSARNGNVIGTVKPIRVGKSIQVWNIEIKDEDNKLICVSRLTVAVIAI